MTRTRLFRPVLAVLTTVAATFVTAPVLADGPPAAASTVVQQSQQIYDVTIDPALSSPTNTSQLYFASAKSTSGLPVKVTVDPSSAYVCSASASTQDPTWVQAMAPGNCIVHFNQAGDENYLPAPEVSKTIVVEKDYTILIADPAVKGVLGLTPTKFAARLYLSVGFGVPLIGQTVSFEVAGKVLCSGVVGNDAYARCSAPVGVVNALTARTYTAVYAGNRYLYPDKSTAPLRG